MFKNKETIVVGVILLLVIGLGGYYCPFKWVTGLPCPGCGMTHAALSFIHLDFHQSFIEHAMFLPTLLSIGLWFLSKEEKQKKWILYTWVTLMLGYYGYRMLYYFPNYPMAYSKNNVFHILTRMFHS